MSRRALLGFTLSAAAVGFLLIFVDLPDFGEVLRPIRPVTLLPFLASIVLIALLLALRWKQLAGPALGYGAALSASLVGTGGNMVLPLRGGDLLKVLRTSRGGSVPLAASAGGLVVEKVLDLATTATIAVFAIGVLLTDDNSRATNEVLIASGATLLVLVLGFISVRYRGDFLRRNSERVLDRLGLGSLHSSLLQPLLLWLAGPISFGGLLSVLGVTAMLHLVFYAFIYMYLGWLIGIDLRYAEALFVLVAAAFGMTVPTAPSGVGVYHAAIASAFYAMGRPVSEGLALGVIVHALSFAAFLIPAGIIWLIDAIRFVRRRRSAPETP